MAIISNLVAVKKVAIGLAAAGAIASGVYLANNKNPLIGDKNPIINNNKTGITSNNNPLIGDKNPLIGDKNPIINNKNGITSNNNPLIGDKNPLIGDKNPIINNKNGITSNNNPLIGDKNPIINNGKNPIINNKNGITSNNNPLIGDKNPIINSDKNPIINNKNGITSNEKGTNHTLDKMGYHTNTVDNSLMVAANISDKSLFHYKFSNNIITIFGDFKKTGNEVYKLPNSLGYDAFLYYKGDYYGLKNNVNTNTPLQKIEDSSVKSSLDVIRDKNN